MFRPLLLLFIIIPIIEISLLMQVGDLIGAWPTVAIVIFTAWLGAKNVRQQGIATLNSVQTKMAQGQMPSEDILTGVMLLIAGVLLMTPGFVTDTFGLLLLTPAFRGVFIGTLQDKIKVNGAHSSPFQGAGGFEQHNVYEHEPDINNDEFHNKEPLAGLEKHDKPRQGQTLDGDFERKD